MAKRKKKTSADLVNALFKKTSKKAKTGNQKISSLWNPYTDGITYSFISKFLSCKERTRLSYVEGWRPKSFKLPLEFGNIFHEMKETYYSCWNMDKARKCANDYVNKKMKRHGYSGAEAQELDQLRALCHTTFIEYISHWNRNPSFTQKGIGRFTDRDINWIFLERKFKFPFRLSNGKTIQLTGKIDGELIDPLSKKGDNRYRVLENKTKQKIEEFDIEHALKKDCQTMIYLLANQNQFQKVPAGVLYNVIRRTSMKPKVKETYKEFCERIGSDIRSRPDFYFLRYRIDITQEDIDIFVQKTLDPILCQIVNWWESISENPFNPWVVGDGTKKNELHHERPFGLYENNARDPANDFAEIIHEGNYSSYEQRDVCFPELEDE